MSPGFVGSTTGEDSGVEETEDCWGGSRNCEDILLMESFPGAFLGSGISSSLLVFLTSQLESDFAFAETGLSLDILGVLLTNVFTDAGEAAAERDPV